MAHPTASSPRTHINYFDGPSDGEPPDEHTSITLMTHPTASSLTNTYPLIWWPIRQRAARRTHIHQFDGQSDGEQPDEHLSINLMAHSAASSPTNTCTSINLMAHIRLRAARQTHNSYTHNWEFPQRTLITIWRNNLWIFNSIATNQL